MNELKSLSLESWMSKKRWRTLKYKKVSSITISWESLAVGKAQPSIIFWLVVHYNSKGLGEEGFRLKHQVVITHRLAMNSNLAQFCPNSIKILIYLTRSMWILLGLWTPKEHYKKRWMPIPMPACFREERKQSSLLWCNIQLYSLEGEGMSPMSQKDFSISFQETSIDSLTPWWSSSPKSL